MASEAKGHRFESCNAHRGLWLLFLAALLFSAMALSVKQAARRLPGPEVAFLRFAFGLLAVGVEVLRGRRLVPRSPGSLFLRGAFGGAAVLLYFLAIAHLPVGIATLLNYSSPLFTALFAALFLNEPLGLRAVFCLFVTLAGVALTVQGGIPAELLGRSAWSWVAVGMASAVLSGAAVTTIRGMRHREGSWEIFLAFCLVGGAITSVPTVLGWVAPTPAEWLTVGLVGLTSVAAQILMTHALRDVRAAIAGLLLQVTPVSTFLLGTALFHEPATALGVLGALVALLGITWGARPAERPAAARPSSRSARP